MLISPAGQVGASGENVDDLMFTMEEVTEGSAAAAMKGRRYSIGGFYCLIAFTVSIYCFHFCF